MSKLCARKFRTLAHELHKVIKMKIDGELSLPLRMTAAMKVQHESQSFEEPALSNHRSLMASSSRHEKYAT